MDGAASDHRETFAAHLESTGGAARWSTAREVTALVQEAVRQYDNGSVAYTDAVATLLPTLIPELETQGVRCVAARSIDDALACPVALSAGELAVAETGTVLVPNRELAQRAPSMLSSTHLILLPADRLAPDLDAAGAWLRDNVAQQPYVSFITGPSRSADIQRTLTIGVQGPKEVTVVFVAEKLL